MTAMAQTLEKEEFDKVREFFYRKTGIYFEDSKRYFVDKRIFERVAESGAANFKDYFSLLRFGNNSNELQELVNIMTVNETYFFREEYQFKCLVESILPEIVRNKKSNSPIRIWSVPSSSGEEPYSIAMYLLEHWPDIHRYDVQIVASDIDTSILNMAKKGLYSSRSVQNLPRKLLEKYFTKKVNNEFQLHNDIVSAVEFTKCNLIDPVSTMGMEKFDVVFCRNLLIYFDDTSRRTAADVFYNIMNPQGFICLGHSESMSRISSLFKIRKFHDAIVYQKP